QTVVIGDDGAQAASPPHVRLIKEQLFLAGLPEMIEFLQVTADQPAPAVPWPLQWQKAVARRDALTVSEAGVADNAKTLPLTNEMEALLAPVRGDSVNGHRVTPRFRTRLHPSIRRETALARAWLKSRGRRISKWAPGRRPQWHR